MAVKPVLGVPPSQYDVGYFQQLVRNLNAYFTQVSNPGDVIAGSVTFVSGPKGALGGGGLILKDSAVPPHFWRVTVDNTGSLVTTDLGTSITVG